MKRQVAQYQYANEIKQFYKKFKVLDQPSIKILFEFCQFDLVKTSKILEIAKQLPSPISVVKKLIDQPEKAQEYLNDLQERYNKTHKLYAQQLLLQKNQLNEEKKLIKIQNNEGIKFFTFFPEDAIIAIMNFLDPYSLINFSRTCKLMNKLTQSEALSQYYKKLCLILFKSYQPSLPQPSNFIPVKNYVLNHPFQFSPNIRNFVINNLRYFIWKVNTESFKLDKNYYLNFGSYKNLFKKCPRLNFNGFYICKHRYVKIGEKTHINLFTPVHVIHYYRYIRFLQDGSVLYQVSTKKLKIQQIYDILSKKNLQSQQPLSMVGQYMQYKNTVYVKALKDNSIFNFEFQIKSNDQYICDELLIKSYGLQLIDNTQIVQRLYEWTPDKQTLSFNYQKCSQLSNQNSPSIKSASL